MLHPTLPVRNAVLMFDQMGNLTAYRSSTGVLIEHKDSNRIVHDLEVIFIGYENEFGEYFDLIEEHETITDDAVPQDLAQVPPPAQEDRDCDGSCEDVHPREHSFIGGPQDCFLGKCVEEEREIVKTVIAPVIPIGKKISNSKVRYILSPEEVREVDWHAYFDAIKASREKEPEVIDAPELETLMDIVVPPLIQQEAKPHPSPVTSICATDYVEEVFFSGDESESEVENSIPKVSDDSTLEVIEDPYDWMTEFEREMMESPSLGMMMSMMMGDNEVGDYFEDIYAPLEGETGETPSVGMLEDEIVLYDIPPDIPLEITLPEPISVSGYHYVESYADYLDSPPKIRPPRKKIWGIGDEYDLRMIETPSVRTYRGDRLLGYLLGVVFRPSKFKCWWIEPREVDDSCLSFNEFYIFMVAGVPLRVEAVPRRIKEKPPD
ncbi:hypothetical protein QVD17_19160 [Tagetes erecta]|uniref:Uncharacterized protein n=1 Tax=Tagetes erecta TaxID=13708 RepID=A0AAD8KMH6_TARER|nr:hypothetical protein QVD17_19160 [Tagetes erecta]